MQIYGLVGPSGTGKSHHAAQLSAQLGAELIIDDGLLIKNHRVLAGFSAKFETTKLAAIKRAIFTDLSHRQQVQSKIFEQQVDSILILGTSRKMIQQICENLKLGETIHWISIDDIVSATSITMANTLRKRGMHAIPIVQTQLTEAPFPQFIRKLSQKFLVNKPDIALVQKENLTIVNPLFASGAVYIHPRVLKDSITELIVSRNHPFKLHRVQLDSNYQRIEIHVYLHANWIPNLRERTNKLFQEIYFYLQDNLSFVCPNLKIHLVSIDPPVVVEPLQRIHL